jgi:hypothetical protein
MRKKWINTGSDGLREQVPKDFASGLRQPWQRLQRSFGVDRTRRLAGTARCGERALPGFAMAKKVVRPGATECDNLRKMFIFSTLRCRENSDWRRPMAWQGLLIRLTF